MHSRQRQIPFDVEHCSPIALRNILLDPCTPADMLERIAHVYYDDDHIARDLIRCPNLTEATLVFLALTSSDEIKHFITSTRVVDVVMEEDAAAAAAEAAKEHKPKKKLNMSQIVNKMTPSQKIKLAQTGAKDARTLLIRESSKIIALAVIANPKLTVGEVEFFAKSTSLNEDVLRKIGSNAEWCRKPSVASALVNNPKTPVGISLGFVSRMTERDLALLERNRNIPEAVRASARSLVIKKKMGKG
ncbi:MAG: hypothetical protein A2X58_03560 [Nitrospirae bacterium GWC2_56_14]|nr:MAG: hypothetical protein A2X58_03560 [Nitrospirae bacterium GWC2_56_14]